MKFLFRHFLLLGVILGLVGQGVAFASPPCATMQQEQASAMAGMPDCAMSQHKSGKQSAPCKNMTPGCLAMAGCAALVGLEMPSPTIGALPSVTVAYLWRAMPVLYGRNVPPDPYPPSFLG
jgi:hypothetical protein